MNEQNRFVQPSIVPNITDMFQHTLLASKQQHQQVTQEATTYISNSH